MRSTGGTRAPLLLPTTALAAAWCALIVAAPLMHGAGHHTSAILLRAMFTPLCHQLPGRSFAIGGEPLAVCARCAGIYGGFLAGCLGAVLASLAPRRAGCERRSPPGRWPLMLGALPSAIEALAGRAGLLPDSALCRALSGALFGAVTVPYLLAALEELPGEVAREFRRFLRIAGRSHAGTG